MLKEQLLDQLQHFAKNIQHNLYAISQSCKRFVQQLQNVKRKKEVVKSTHNSRKKKNTKSVHLEKVNKLPLQLSEDSSVGYNFEIDEDLELDVITEAQLEAEAHYDEFIRLQKQKIMNADPSSFSENVEKFAAIKWNNMPPQARVAYLQLLRNGSQNKSIGSNQKSKKQSKNVKVETNDQIYKDRFNRLISKPKNDLNAEPRAQINQLHNQKYLQISELKQQLEKQKSINKEKELSIEDKLKKIFEKYQC